LLERGVQLLLAYNHTASCLYRKESSVFEFSCFAERGEGVEKLCHSFFVGAGETFGDIVFGGGGVDGDEHRLHGGGLFGEGFGPSEFLGGFGFGCFGFGFVLVGFGGDLSLCLALGVVPLWILIGGPQVADDAAAFFFGSFVVEGDDFFTEFADERLLRPSSERLRNTSTRIASDKSSLRLGVRSKTILKSSSNVKWSCEISFGLIRPRINEIDEHPFHQKSDAGFFSSVAGSP
jgi:hypothetical protein